MWRLYQLIPVVGLVILTLMRGGAGCFSPRSLSGPREPAPRYAWLACSLLSISDADRPGVAGCVGNGSMLARGGSLMERLWLREVRRAARRASAPFARQIALGCGAAAVGTMAASLLPPQVDGSVGQAVWAALWALAGYVTIWTGLFVYQLWRYRSSGFRDYDWLARHDDSDPGGALFLELVRRSGGSLNSGVDLELWVKSHGNWETQSGRSPLGRSVSPRAVLPVRSMSARGDS